MSSNTLIFDADDTLWENNIYFEDAFDQFCSYLSHSSLSPDQVRTVLDEIELVNAKIHGYGSKNFARNLAQCFQHLAERAVSDRDLEAVGEFAYAILDRPIELLPGVHETLTELATRHRLVMFTKGDQDEQQIKVDRSGLGALFRHVQVAKEKNQESYAGLTSSQNCVPEQTWMIGKSPKSDINPALALGLNAVYIPHPRTWSLEIAEIPTGHPRLMVIERFSELTDHF